MLSIVGHIDGQLCGIGIVESFWLEFYKYMAFQDAMVEDKVDAFIGIVDENLLLSRLEAKTFTHFKDELLKMTENAILKIFLIPFQVS